MYLRRLSAALEAATPSLSSGSLMVEASPEGDAQMEMDALGCDGEWVLGLPIGGGLSPSPGL